MIGRRHLVPVLVAILASAAFADGPRSVRRARSPALSPDGAQIAFAYRGDVWVVPREGGSARRITSHPAYDSGPAWSPDGKALAFTSMRHGAWDAFVVDAAGGSPRRVTRHSGHDLVECWYDASTLMIRTTRYGSSDLALVPLDGTTPRRLTRTFLDGEMYASVVPGGDLVLLGDKSAYSYRRRRFRGSAASDVWVLRIRGNGPRWRRLVDSEWMDVFPIATPDGKTVRFVSNRSGSRELWSVPLAGGEPRQITRLGGRGMRRPTYSADGRLAAFVHDDRIHVMALPDGEIRPVQIHVGLDAERNPVEHSTVTSGADEFDVSPDGKLLAVVVRGEIFVSPTEDGGLARNVTGTVARETQIAWGSDSRTLYFVSDRDGNREVYRTDLLEGTTDRLTETPEQEAWPTPSPDGERVVWMRGSSTLVVVPEETGTARRARLDRVRRFGALAEIGLPDDVDEDEASRFAAQAADFASGRRPVEAVPKAAVPFLLRAMAACDPETAEGRTSLRRLNDTLRKTTGYPMQDVDPDRHDADRFRETSLWWETYWNDRRDEKHPIAFEAPEGFQAPPAFAASEAREAIEVEVSLADMGLWGGRPLDWSPDSRWVAFPQRGPGYRTDVFVLDANADGGAVHRVTALPSASQPRFSRDGERLVFVSSLPEDSDVHVVDLAAPERTFPDDPLREVLDPEPAKKPAKDKTKKPEAVTIDLERIVDRAVRATSFATNESDPLMTPDGKTILFTADLGDSRELWSLPAPHVEGPRRLKQLTKGERPSSIRLSGDGKRVLWLASGRVRSMPVAGGSAKTHAFRAEMAIDRAAEMRYVLDEAMWLLRTWFYDPEHHGVDWAPVEARFRALLADTSPGLDFEYLLDSLCAELDASHSSASGGSTGGESEPATALLGIDLDDAALAGGKHVVAAVLPDGPAAHDEVRLAKGDLLLSVDGVDLGPGVNLHSLLRGKVGRRVIVRVRSADGAEREVTIKPVDDRTVRNLRYESWVRERRAKVAAWSDGRLAYLHVRSMNTPSLERFRRDILIEAEGKAGAIIDVRYNGGGWTAVHILDALARRPYVMRSFRTGARVSENRYRDHGLEIPLAALTNHASFSNAEIFSEGFRRLGLGPVVGVPTAGGVIGTGSWKLLNGMRLRRPSWGAWTLDGGNLEGEGRPVTDRVENGPGVEGHEEDRQLRKAVDLLLGR